MFVTRRKVVGGYVAVLSNRLLIVASIPQKDGVLEALFENPDLTKAKVGATEPSSGPMPSDVRLDPEIEIKGTSTRHASASQTSRAIITKVINDYLGHSIEPVKRTNLSI